MASILNKLTYLLVVLSLGGILALPTSLLASAIGAPGSKSSDQVATSLRDRVNESLKRNTSQQNTTLNQESFADVPSSLFSLSRDQIHELRRLYNENQQAGAFTGDVPSRPTSSSVMVDLKPGATPPVIRLAAGYVSSVVFYDQSGAPWPIQSYDVGNPSVFNIHWSPSTPDTEKSGQNMGNTLLMQSMSMYREGNLAVILRGLNTPIMLTLVPGQKAVDYRADMHVPRNGPYARPTVSSLPAVSSPVLLDLVNHIPPAKSKSLTVTGGAGEAWLLGGSMFVRTSLIIISPSWIATMSGADGSVHAYEMKPTSVLLAVENGQTVQLKIKGL